MKISAKNINERNNNNPWRWRRVDGNVGEDGESENENEMKSEDIAAKASGGETRRRNMAEDESYSMAWRQ